ncbi:hypothetical protein SAY87_016410 [Trapa incisa]|uniref:Transcriptional coactivator p15 (PC4) C-terminal domain-containing protein n=1 Tax=Trapa incisa TaxID=236973 RepID=A0AAN7QUC7_9MYRT|nr:hypothetical protein SAY87_016410 [Trapa incisa]
MSGKVKRKNDGHDSGDSEGHAPSKKILKNDSDGIVFCELSKNRKVTVRNWKGRLIVDIREFYSKDGKELPSKKGRYPSCFRIFISFKLPLFVSIVMLTLGN